ncbi:U-scoloptoxin(01)-Er1a-like [Centruroides vittatus]|uniref:U-scoloptoxin(01)-Er1a-like n=1 Tax=Centruroides vittatus TaxID=120091 RepID=UPI00350FCF30
MKYILLALALLAVAIAFPRTKRQAFQLPDGAFLLLGKEPPETFDCSNKATGYYADLDTGCQVFHVCNQVEHKDGSKETFHYSFICGNQTIFSQLTMTCATPEEATPCQSAPEFYRLNQKIGLTDTPILEDADVEKHNQLRQL